MNFGYLKKLKKKHILKRIFVERLTEPLHVNLLACFVFLFGSYRSKILFDLVLRQNHAYSLLYATEYAIKNGIKKITVIEFGVAMGGGLMNICKISSQLSKLYDIEFRIFGFDTGEGMPEPLDYRDHPELYKKGDFRMDREKLEKELPENCTLIIGKVKDTVTEFLSTNALDEAPLGFVSFDLDYYYSTKEALQILLHQDPSKYLSVFPVYLDDIALPSHNSYCGELLARKEFNEENKSRKIERNRFLPYTRVFKHSEWLEHIFFVHVLDAKSRNEFSDSTEYVVLENPYF
jgi:hypothetical protein